MGGFTASGSTHPCRQCLVCKDELYVSDMKVLERSYPRSDDVIRSSARKIEANLRTNTLQYVEMERRDAGIFNLSAFAEVPGARSRVQGDIFDN